MTLSDTLENALFDPPDVPYEQGPIEKSVIQVIEGLRDQKLISGKYEAVATALTSIAHSVDAGMVGGRGVSVATANLAKLLMEGLDNLPEPVVGLDPFYDALDAQIQALTKDALQ